ncbi:vacuole effluxer Atg22 like protein [Nitzschia inconspicua]|uniref:Vacuole effluxer Atg22 like protein n=1 Tax=Nitzschia inconspicua TaxID=303405 RepID=A0A9K3PNX5_9STRA|nr:vacuole effluxer Atg22 like protein [Nitzschia inconspicua]
MTAEPSSNAEVTVPYSVSAEPMFGHHSPPHQLPRCYPKWRGQPIYRGNPEGLGWALDGVARSVQFIGAGAFLSTTLLRLAKEAAGCETEAPKGEMIPECNETIYGIKPSSLLTTYTMVVGVASSAMLPLIGAVIDYTPHRLAVGRAVSFLYTVLIFPTIFLNDKTWFAVAVIQVVISVVGWVQTSITYAYLPELTTDELLLGEWTKSFTMTQFLSMVLYLAVIIGGLTVVGKSSDDVLTSQVAMIVAFVANATILPVVWGCLFQKRQPLHSLPEGRSLWTQGFRQLWETSKHISKNYRSLKWFYISIAFSDAGIQTLATVAITYLTDQLQFTATENGLAILLMLCGSVPGAWISNFATRRFDPIRSSMMALALLITATALVAIFVTGPGQYLRTYIMAFFWGTGVGWKWTCDRLTASSVIPEGQDTELMGVFLFAGQCLSWLPPLVFTAINEAGVSQRVGVASLNVWLVMSLMGYCIMGNYTTAREQVNRATVFGNKMSTVTLDVGGAFQSSANAAKDTHTTNTSTNEMDNF